MATIKCRNHANIKAIKNSILDQNNPIFSFNFNLTDLSKTFDCINNNLQIGILILVSHTSQKKAKDKNRIIF